MLSTKFKAMACLCRNIAIEIERQETNLRIQSYSKPATPKDRLLSLDEIMQILNKSDTTIYRYRKEMGLKCIKKGKSIFMWESELTKWLNDKNYSNVGR